MHFLVRTGLETLRTNGLHITGPGEELHVPKVNCHSSTNEIGACDLVVIAIKTTANAVLPQLIAPLVGTDTRLMTLQNGLGNEELLAGLVDARRVLAGLCFICLRRTSPGVVHRYDYGHISIGEYSGSPTQGTDDLANEFQRCGIKCAVVTNLMLERWRKLVWNIPFNGLSIVAGGIDTAGLLADADLRDSVGQLMDEVIAGANQCGFPLETAAAEEQMKRTATMGGYKPSTLLDFEAGKPLEIEAIWGEPLRRAEAAGAAMPRLRQLTSLLKSLDRLQQRRSARL